MRIVTSIDCSATSQRELGTIDPDDESADGETLVIQRFDGEAELPVVQLFSNGDIGVWDSAIEDCRYVAGPRLAALRSAVAKAWRCVEDYTIFTADEETAIEMLLHTDASE